MMETQEIEPRIYEQARRAAKSALVQWFSGQWTRQSEALDDLCHDLIVWYLENPSTQEKMGKLSDPEMMVTFRLHARQILSDQRHEANVAEGQVLYSSESIKTGLKELNDKNPSNIWLQIILPYALDRISAKQKSVLISRYEFGNVPPPGSEQFELHYALKSLTDEVNVMYLTSTVDNIGSKTVVFPEMRKPQANHSDETGNTALLLLDVHPSIVDEWHYEPSLGQSVKGAALSPVVELGPSGRYRLTPAEYEWMMQVPAVVAMFADLKEEQWHSRWDRNRPGQWWWTADTPVEEFDD